MSEIICPSCKTAIKPAKFCSECGAFLTNKAVEEPVKQVNAEILKPAAKAYVPNTNTSVSDAGLKMLVNCCHKTVATVGGDGYSEIVLYERSKDEYELHFYSKYEYDTSEIHYAYKADKKIVDEVYSYLREANLEQHAGKGGGIFGGEFIVKYLLDGTIHRLTLGNYDYDHRDMLYKVEQIINTCQKEENILK